METAFANVLLTGPCNLRCPDCIGTQLRAARESLLHRWPLPGLDSFVATVRDHAIEQISVTGIDTEPMLYQHTAALLRHLRAAIPNVEISLHTNGTRVLQDLGTFHLYDRATISLPSLDPQTCLRMTGSRRVLDLAAIRKEARIPIKLSVLMTEHNRAQIPHLLTTIGALGYRRVALRRRYGESRPYNPLADRRPSRSYACNPVYDLDGVEVTLWDFETTRLPCINLFPDGSVRGHYLLAEAMHG